MRILFISQYFFPEQFSNNSIALNLKNSDHDVEVVCCVPNYPQGRFFPGYSNSNKREEIWKGIPIFRARTIARGVGKIHLIANYLAFPLFGSVTAISKIKGRPDVSFVSQLSPLTQALVGIFFRWRRGTPTVIWVQDLWPESVVYTLNIKSRLINRFLMAVCGWIYRRADMILVQSAAFPPMIERFGVEPSRIRVYPNSAPETYRPLEREDAPDEAELVPQDGFRLMFAGNIGESQDFDTIIQCAKLLRDERQLKWVIVGSGRDMERVRKSVSSNGLDGSFTFAGRFPEERMPFFFAHADAMLVSLKRNPAFSLTVPYKVQCYMACGKPMIASLDGEGARIINKANAGFCAPASEPEKLAEVVRAMMQLTTAERASLGTNGRKFYNENYSAEKVNADLIGWLKEAADASQKPF